MTIYSSILIYIYFIRRTMSVNLKIKGAPSWSSFYSATTSFNALINLYSRDIGVLSPLSFVSNYNSRRLDEIRLSKYRSIPSLAYSVTWLGLENIENRLYSKLFFFILHSTFSLKLLSIQHSKIYFETVKFTRFKMRRKLYMPGHATTPRWQESGTQVHF